MGGGLGPKGAKGEQARAFIEKKIFLRMIPVPQFWVGVVFSVAGKSGLVKG